MYKLQEVVSLLYKDLFYWNLYPFLKQRNHSPIYWGWIDDVLLQTELFWFLHLLNKNSSQSLSEVLPVSDFCKNQKLLNDRFELSLYYYFILFNLSGWWNLSQYNQNLREEAVSGTHYISRRYYTSSADKVIVTQYCCHVGGFINRSIGSTNNSFNMRFSVVLPKPYFLFAK